MTYDKDSLIRLFDRMVALRRGLGWVSKKKIDETLKEWRREDRLHYSILMSALSDLDNIESL
jgi:hypothetical protein